jgi:hypothetical protein
MILKRSFVGSLGIAMLLASAVSYGGSAKADGYRPGDFLMLDLNQAALSPKPLGPPAQFERVQVEAKADPITSEPAAEPATPAQRRHVPAVRKVKRPHSNPLDANAADTRVQVWPCRSGGICKWRN